jgi:hypothetical protein
MVLYSNNILVFSMYLLTYLLTYLPVLDSRWTGREKKSSKEKTITTNEVNVYLVIV